MSEQQHTLPPMGGIKKSKNKIFPVLTVLIITFVLISIMIKLKPEIDRKAETEFVPMVDTMKIKSIDFVVPIKTEGMVLPKTKINFSSESVGKIVWIADSFTTGGEFKRGDLLVKIDPRDYQLAITRSQANVSARLANLELEQAKSDLAKSDWKKYGKKGKPSALNLNLPQVASAKAALEGAKADLDLAKRNLEKTQVVAPFNGTIITKNSDVGQFVNVGTNLAVIASTEAAEIRVSLTDVQLSESGLTASLIKPKVKISSEEIKQTQWLGVVAHVEAQRDARTLMNYVVIHVDHPFVQQDQALRFNTFVTVQFEGKVLQSVFPLQRNYLMLNDRIKVLDNNSKLLIKPVEISYSDEDFVYVSSGLNADDLVITTQLPNIKAGSLLQQNLSR